MLRPRRVAELFCFSFLLMVAPLAFGQAYRFGRSDFTLGTYPGGVAVADFNRDGNLDVAITDGTESTVTILLGKPDGTFVQGQSMTDSSAGTVAVGDFNGDGIVDLAVTNWLSSSVSIYLGVGNGKFGKAITSKVAGYASVVTVADFNGDGKLDIAVTDNSSNDISVLLGRGDGTFEPYTAYTTPGTTIGIVAADFNRDGHMDLAIADTWGNDVYVMLGKGDGTFQTGTSYAAGEVPIRLAAADLNGDGILDLVVSDGPDCGCAYMSVLLGNGDGSFQPPNTIATEGAGDIVIGDFNRDHKLDVALTQSGLVSIFLGNGDGTFQSNVDYGSDGSAIALAMGDFNRDGRIDLVVANFNGNNTTHVSTLLGNGDGTFGNVAAYATGQHPVGVIAADFNGDKKVDLATVNTYDGTVSVLMNAGGGKFGAAASYPVSSGQYGTIVSADFSGDGFPDIATANYSAGTVSILLNRGDGTFAAYKDYAAGASPEALVAGDFNKDGKTDLIVGNAGAGLSLLLGNGSGGFGSPISFGSGLSPYAIAVGDFNGDGNLDLATVSGSWSTSVVSILLGKGDGTFGAAVNYSTGTGPIAVVAADFNRDGKTDLAVLTNFLTGISILLGNGDGTFQNYVSYAAPNYPSGLLAGNFNGKNLLDLVVMNPFNNAVDILTGDGNGGFGALTSYYPGIGPAGVVAADLDNNGSTDLAVTNAIYSTSSVTVMLNGAVAALFPGSEAFPATAVGSKSQAKIVKFSNPGTVAVRIQSISIVGRNPSNFSETSTCGSQLAVGASCTVSVIFEPSVKGIRSAMLKFVDDAIGGFQTAALSGTGN